MERNKKRKLTKILLRPYSIIIIAVLFLIAIISAVLYEWENSRRNTLAIMRDTAKTMARTVAFTGEKSTAAMQRIEKELIKNLLIKIRLLREVENSGNLNSSEAEKYSLASGLKLIKINGNGEIIHASITGEPQLTNNHQLISKIKTILLTNNIAEIKVNISPLSSYRKAVIAKCATGNILILTPPSEIFNYRYSIGLGASMKKFAELPDIHYIVWKDDEGIVSAAGNFNDFLDEAKRNDDVMEFKIPALMKVENASNGVFLVGMKTDELKRIESEGITRIVVTFLIIILITGIFIKITTMRRRHELEQLQNEKYISLGKLAAGVAHEVRNPLNAVALSLQQLLSDRTLVEKDPDNAMLLTTACDEIKRADVNLTQFLQYARPPKLSTRMTEIKVLFGKVVNVISLQAEQQNIKIDFEAQENLRAELDPELIHQALLNVALNGLDSMTAGGNLRFTARKRHETLEIEIADTGCGIKPKDLEHVFELYYTTKHKGVGLGLPYVHRIVSLHGGSIKIKKNVPVGTRVILTFSL